MTKRLAKTSDSEKLLLYIAQLSLLAVYKAVSTVSAPVHRLFSFYLWLGRSTLKLTTWAQRVLLKVVAWLASPAWPRDHWIRHWQRSHVPVDIRRWHLVIGAVMTASLIKTLINKWREAWDDRLRGMRECRGRMHAAGSYAEWREFAQQLAKLEHISGADAKREWHFDRKLLAQKTAHLRRVRQTGNIKDMMFALRTDLIRNVANIGKSDLHEAHLEVPEDIQEYIQEVKEQLQLLTDWHEAGVTTEEKLNFFREARHAYGRTALLLSGGGGLGSFHIGVVKALFEARLLPRVLAGSSVGSIVAGITATRTDDELRETLTKMQDVDVQFFNNRRPVELAHHFIHKGHLQDPDFLIRKLRDLLGEMTFLEAYERTGRILNITVCAADTREPARMLNYLTAPQALIWSAVAASSAFPGLFPAQHLLARNSRGEVVRFSAPSTHEAVERRWRDGSLELDLPTFLLAEMFNCNHFLVSQTNPHIVPLLNVKGAVPGRVGQWLELELKAIAARGQLLMPGWPSSWMRLFTQPWEGDITFVLPSSLWHVGKTVVNPSADDLLQFTRHGELAVWERRSAVRANCDIESTLDMCLARLTNRVRERPLSTINSRIPSWLHMSHIGAPAVASWGEGDAGSGALGRTANGSGYGPAVVASGLTVAAGLHEAVPDDRPRRVQSWGQMEVADSVSEFPAAYGAQLIQGGRRDSDEMGSMSSAGSGDVGDGVPRVRSSSSAGSSSGIAPDPGVLAQLDCCDPSVSLNLWDDLLPLAANVVATEEAGDGGAAGTFLACGSQDGQGLDCIAP